MALLTRAGAVVLTVVLALAGGGCSLVAPFDFTVELDGGRGLDGGPRDAGRFDAGTDDAGGADAGAMDAGADAGPGCRADAGGWIDQFDGPLDPGTWTVEVTGAFVEMGTNTLVLRASPGAAVGAHATVTTEGVRPFDFTGRSLVLDFDAAPMDPTVVAKLKIVLSDGRWVSVEQHGDQVQGWLHLPDMPGKSLRTDPLASFAAGRFRVSHGCSGEISFYIGPRGMETMQLGSIDLGAADVSDVSVALELYVDSATTAEQVFEIQTIQIP